MAYASMRRFAAMSGALLAAASAQATVFTFSYAGKSVSASGTFTTTDTAVGGYYTITGMTGSRNGTAMTLLAPDTFPAVSGNDNLLKVAAPNLTFNGFSFKADRNYNVFYRAATNSMVECFGNCVFNSPQEAVLSSFTVTRTSAVPEPATWAAMVAGFALVGATLRRRSPKSEAVVPV